MPILRRSPRHKRVREIKPANFTHHELTYKDICFGKVHINENTNGKAFVENRAKENIKLVKTVAVLIKDLFNGPVSSDTIKQIIATHVTSQHKLKKQRGAEVRDVARCVTEARRKIEELSDKKITIASKDGIYFIVEPVF
jgi:bacterioferritin-associated ferredoxin